MVPVCAKGGGGAQRSGATEPTAGFSMSQLGVAAIEDRRAVRGRGRVDWLVGGGRRRRIRRTGRDVRTDGEAVLRVLRASAWATSGSASFATQLDGSPLMG